MSIFTVVYALEEPPESYEKSIFLAGPTPRTDDVRSWRPEALELLQTAGFDGVVFVPETRSGVWHGDTASQVEWEDRTLHLSDCILFWVPRNLDTMPALTTNVEFGRWEDSGRIVVGSPAHAVRNNYLLHYAHKLDVPVAATLDEVIELALSMVAVGATRTGGEREVPLYIWQTPSFQQWYGNLKRADNRLDHAKVVWTFRVGPNRKFVFFWALHVDVYIAIEERNKTNEVVLGRPDISTVMLYKRAPHLDDCQVVLVEEYRAPVSNGIGYVIELAGGSSLKPEGNPLQLAADEVREESGLVIETGRFSQHEARQLSATMSAHKAHLFSVEVTDDELAEIWRNADIPFGVAEDSERTYVSISTVRDIRSGTVVDWSMLGMILQVLA